MRYWFCFLCFIVILIIHIKHLFTLFLNFYIQSTLNCMTSCHGATPTVNSRCTNPTRVHRSWLRVHEFNGTQHYAHQQKQQCIAELSTTIILLEVNSGAGLQQKRKKPSQFCEHSRLSSMKKNNDTNVILRKSTLKFAERVCTTEQATPTST